MSDDADRKPQGWTEAALNAVIGWFPDLPQWVRVIFASATIYLVLCLVAQVSPVALFEAIRGEFRGWVVENRAIAAAERLEATQERRDIVELLREQNADLRAQMALTAPPERLAWQERQILQLQRQMDVLLDQHPVARQKARAAPE